MSAYSVLPPTRFDGGSRFIFGLEATQANHHSIYEDAGSPFTPSSMKKVAFLPVHTFVQGRADPLRAILRVHGFRDNAKVTPTIVKPLPILVIDHQRIAVGQAHNLAVQIDRLTRDQADGVIIATQPPAVRFSDGGVGTVDQAVRSDRTILSMQGDEDDILKAHQGYLLVSCPWSVSALAGVSCMVAEGAA
jgi:hypothetical protein